MSVATLYESSWVGAGRREGYRLPAGILALAVHGAFFALLYLGFAWQTKPPEMMSVELWENLPETVEVPPEVPAAPEVAPPVQPIPPTQPAALPPPPPAAQPEKTEKPDIALPDKKKIEIKRPEKKATKKKADAKSTALEAIERKRAAEQEEIARMAAQKAELERAEQAAARSRVVNEYTTKIKNKITRNIVMPPAVPDDALAVFRVTLLPGGSILSAEMKQSSGNAAYDNAVERAILKSDPLPLPADAAMFKDFRVLRLEFQPRK